jgi:hypothetical protein
LCGVDFTPGASRGAASSRSCRECSGRGSAMKEMEDGKWKMENGRWKMEDS